MSEMTFENLILEKDGLIKGPFGSDVKKSLFIPYKKGAYKIYEQGIVLNKDISEGSYYLEEEYVDKKLTRFVVKAGDYLLTGAGTLGELFKVPQQAPKGIINQALLRIRLNENVIDDMFFPYYFKFHIKNIIKRLNGDSVIPNLPPLPIIKATEVKIPTKKHQQKIARVLSSLDDKIELNNKINAALEKLAKTIYEYWFVQNAEEKWERKSLRELGEFKNGANYEKANEIEKYLLNENDIVFARSGIPGATRLIEKTEEDVIFCGFAIRFRLNDKSLKDYLFFPLKQNEEFAKNKSGGSIMPNISQDSLKEISITIPPNSILEKFNKTVSPLFSTIIKNRQESAHLAQLRDFLLPLLMNGQVTFNP